MALVYKQQTKNSKSSTISLMSELFLVTKKKNKTTIKSIKSSKSGRGKLFLNPTLVDIFEILKL